MVMQRTPSGKVIDFVAERARRVAVRAEPVQIARAAGGGGADLLLHAGTTVALAPARAAVTPIRPDVKTSVGSVDPGQTLMLRATLDTPAGVTKTTYSMVLPNGDVHPFFPLHDGVHHSFSRRFRGRFDRALDTELSRPGAEVIGKFTDVTAVQDGEPRLAGR